MPGTNQRLDMDALQVVQDLMDGVEEQLNPLYSTLYSSQVPPKPSFDDPNLELDLIKSFVPHTMNVMSIKKPPNQEVVLDEVLPPPPPRQPSGMIIKNFLI